MEAMTRVTHFSPAEQLKSLGCRPGDLADIVVLCGQRKRALSCLERLTDARQVFSFAGLTFHTGIVNGARVSVGNAGMYADDTAISMELLIAGGVRTFIRVGSCGALSGKMAIGDAVCPLRALRGEGVTPYYVDGGYQPRADEEVSRLLRGGCDGVVDVHAGTVWTMGALFREVPSVVNPAIAQGAVAVDMVTSVVLTLADINGCRAGALLTVSDNLISGEKGFSAPACRQTEQKLIEAAFSSVVALSASAT
jgi:uridine phosphorylase